MINKRNLLVVCIIMVGLSLPFFALYPQHAFSASTQQEIDDLNKDIAAKKDKIAQLEKSIEEYKKKITQKQLEAVSLSNQMAILNNRVTETELDIEATQEKLDTVSMQIEQLQLGIEEKQLIIERQKKILAELIRTLTYENGKKYIEIMAAYKNFSDFYNRVQYVKRLEQDMGNSAKQIRLAKEDLDTKKADAEKRQKEYEDLKAQLDEKKQNLKEQTNYKSQLLSQTKSSEATYKTLLSNLKSQYQQIESDITATEQKVRQKLAQQQQFLDLGSQPGLFAWPVPSRYITAYFHDPDYPYRNVFEHPAVDVRASQGTPVRATKSGYVGRARTCTTASCYAYVMIMHAQGFSTVYGHLNRIVVSEEQFVTQGDIIGYSGAMPGTVGAGPFTTGPHLHFEIRSNGIPVNPLNYLVKDY
jgi:murein DD-endopeptidase MepM/ murein hydrolase activator NlpD